MNILVIKFTSWEKTSGWSDSLKWELIDMELSFAYETKEIITEQISLSC